MPGKSVKNYRKYHALRRKGYGKGKAARIANKKANGHKNSMRMQKK